MASERGPSPFRGALSGSFATPKEHEPRFDAVQAHRGLKTKGGESITSSLLKLWLSACMNAWNWHFTTPRYRARFSNFENVPS
jgi:hypothetical protein